MNKRTILFLCTHNAARSQIAEAFINVRFGDQYEVMAELGIDISKQHAKSLNEFDDSSFDYVVTMCADAAENCPIFPSGVTYLHHPFDDPEADAGSDQEHCASFRNVRDRIGEWIEATFSYNP
jgi:arsenate reductase